MKNSANPTTAPAPTSPNLRNFVPIRRRVYSPHGVKSLTRQEFKSECDINKILAKYQRTGALTHFSKFQGSYGDFSSCDYQEAQNLILRAQKMFAELPSKVRDLVKTPEGFLNFVQDPANSEKMAELGLRERKASETPAPAASPDAQGA